MRNDEMNSNYEITVELDGGSYTFNRTDILRHMAESEKCIYRFIVLPRSLNKYIEDPRYQRCTDTSFETILSELILKQKGINTDSLHLPDEGEEKIREKIWEAIKSAFDKSTAKGAVKMFEQHKKDCQQMHLLVKDKIQSEAETKPASNPSSSLWGGISWFGSASSTRIASPATPMVGSKYEPAREAEIKKGLSIIPALKEELREYVTKQTTVTKEIIAYPAPYCMGGAGSSSSINDTSGTSVGLSKG